MKYHYLFYLCLTLFFLGACKRQQQYTYAIRDFRPALRPVLTKLASKGYVDYDGYMKWLQKHATDDELKMLSAAEHPVLRAIALRAIVDKPGARRMEVIMTHLGDTAMVPHDRGEWGVQFAMVADDMLDYIDWSSEEEMEKVTNEVILKHNNLRSAYMALWRLKKEDKYYAAVRKMVLAKVDYDALESAILALAAYQKQQDIPLIASVLKEHIYDWQEGTFNMLSEYHAPEYFALLEDFFYKKWLHRNLKRYNISDAASYYVQAVASYQTTKSARLLHNILRAFSKYPFDVRIDKFGTQLRFAIWNNRCSAYAELLPLCKNKVLYEEMTHQGIQLDTTMLAVPKRIRW